jgi:hypothetical protein
MRDNNEPHSFGSINRGSTPTQEAGGGGERTERKRRETENEPRRENEPNKKGTTDKLKRRGRKSWKRGRKLDNKPGG